MQVMLATDGINRTLIDHANPAADGATTNSTSHRKATSDRNAYAVPMCSQGW